MVAEVSAGAFTALERNPHWPGPEPYFDRIVVRVIPNTAALEANLLSGSLDYIAGYTVVDDVSVRDWQFRTPTWTMGKSFDTHGPIGPWIVTPDELGDPHRLRLQTFVNGERRQDSNTKELIFDCFTLVEYLSTAFTLEPGDVVATGTPSGIGAVAKPPKLLRAGDVVRVEIEGIGAIENPVVDEPADTPR